MTFDPQKPFNQLPLLPPSVDLDTRPVLKQLSRSRSVLAELKGYADMIPNKRLLLDAVVLLEAKDSSAIENIVTTHDELYKALIADPATLSAAAKEVMNYRAAVYRGYESIRQQKRVTIEMLCEIQAILERERPGIRTEPGTVLMNRQTGKIVYTPPTGEKTLRKLLADMERYLEIADDTDPLIKMAVAHYQFESIHPFYDGNGRTGRILNVLYLVVNDLLDFPLLYLSRHIIANKQDYYRLLQEVRTEGRWEEWVIYLLQAVEQTARWTHALIRDIRDLMETTADKIRADLPKVYSRELVELLFSQPYIRIDTLVAHGLCERRTASKQLSALEDAGFLSSQKEWKTKMFINVALFDLLKKR